MQPLIFISARSDDYKYAEQIYSYLKAQGLPVFFSQESLPELASSDYRKQIDDALDKAQHMIVVTSSRANVESSWVEAEWGLFINEKRSGRKLGNLITVVAGGLRPGDLPASLRYYEVIPFQRESLPKILRYVTAALNQARSFARLTQQSKQTPTLNAGGPAAGAPRDEPSEPTRPEPITAVAVRTPRPGKEIAKTQTWKFPVRRSMYGAVIGGALGASNGMLAGFYEVAQYHSRLSPIIPALMGLFLGALFGSILACSAAGRVVGIIAAIIAALIGAASEGPSAAVGMGLTFGTFAALVAMAVAFFRKNILAKP
jgi:hypothetical protein